MRPAYRLTGRFASIEDSAMPAIIPIPAFADNYIWLLRHDAKAAVVDPGDAAPVIEHLEREGIELCAIVNTHHPRRTTSAANRGLLARWPVPVFRARARNRFPAAPRALVEGDTFTLPGIGLELSVLDIPWTHFRAYCRVSERMVVFCGDTLFAAGCGRLFEGTPAQMLSSLDKLAALGPPGTRVYCGHEYTVSKPSLSRSLSNRKAQRCARVWCASRRSATVVSRRFPRPSAREGETNPFFCVLPMRLFGARGGPPTPGRDLPDRVSVIRRASRLEECILTMSGPRFARSRVHNWPELRAWKNAFLTMTVTSGPIWPGGRGGYSQSFAP